MSRDMGHSYWRPGPSARGSLWVSPVGFGGFDEVGGEDLGGFEFDDGHGGFVGDGEDSFAGVGVADSEVMHAAGSAEAHLSELIEAVVTQAVVPWARAAGGFSFREGSVSSCRGTPVELAVGTMVVVDVPETVELGLEVDQISRRGLLGQPLLQCLMEPLHFALGLRMAGMAVLLDDPEDRQEVFEGVLSAAEAGGVHAAVVSQR